VDLADHLATGEERRHRLEQLPPRPQRPRAHRREHLVAGEGVEVNVVSLGTAGGWHLAAGTGGACGTGRRALDSAA